MRISFGSTIKKRPFSVLLLGIFVSHYSLNTKFEMTVTQVEGNTEKYRLLHVKKYL